MSARQNYLHLRETNAFGINVRIKLLTKKIEKKKYGNKNKR